MSNTPYKSKEEFYKALDALNLLPNNEELHSSAISILDIGLKKLNRLPILVKLNERYDTEDDYVIVEYYSSSYSILHVEGYKDGTFRYFDLEADLREEQLEECFSNRANLKVLNDLQSYKNAFECEQKRHDETADQWRKLHSYLNSLIGLECTDECITNDDKLIKAVNEKFRFFGNKG